MAGYLFPLTSLQRSRLEKLLKEVEGQDEVIDAIAILLNAAARVTDAEAERLIAMGKDLSTLDWEWIEELRREWSAAADTDWTTGEVLGVVMASSRKPLWQPRTA
jgi:hypothetical protein